MNSSPNMLMKKIRSVFPVAGPSAEKANIRNPERNRYAVFPQIRAIMPAIIIPINAHKVSAEADRLI